MLGVNEGRRTLRVQPSSNIKARLKARFKEARQKKHAKAEPTTWEEMEKCLFEFRDFDGNAEHSQVFDNLLRLVKNASKELLSESELFSEVFKKAPSLLCSDDHRIRTAFFRLLRMLLINEERLTIYLDLLVDVFAIRSLDILILPKTERLEALQLVAQLLSVYVRVENKLKPKDHIKFPASALKCVHAVAVHRLVFNEPEDPELKVDELNKAALGILLEMSILSPLLVIDNCSTDWIPRVLVSPGMNNFQIGALVCRVLSAWLDDPVIRERAMLQLVMEQIFAPLLDLGFFNQPDPKLKQTHKITQTLECCTNIFLNLLCTWPGFYACASTEPLIGSIASPLKLAFERLQIYFSRLLSYLGQVKSIGTNLDKIREMVIDVCCDFVCMPYAGRTFINWPDALLFYSRLHEPDMYESSLRDDFVVGEMNSAMAYGTGDNEYVDLLLSFQGLATFVLINFGLVQSLIRLILSAPNEPMALKATLLLGDLLRTSVCFVPKDWKQLLLSTPTLIQLMAQSLLSTVAGRLENRENYESDTSLPNVENSILLLHRLEEIYTMSQTRPSFLSQLKNANLFVLPSKANRDQTTNNEFYEDDYDLDGQCSDAITNFLADDKNKWTHLEFLIQRFRNLPSLFRRWQHNDKCHTFFVQVTEFFAPKNQMFLRETVTHEIVKSGSLAFRLIVRLAEEEPYYKEILENYVTNFCRELPEAVLYNGVFNPRNIMHTNVYLYFGIMAAISSKSYGHWTLEKTGFYQICLDLIIKSSTPIEYVKLIVSSLNYNKIGITRIILETALTATSEHVRKWTTQFLEVLCALEVMPDFEDYGMRLLFQQLADPSGKIVRTAVNILNKWLPKFSKSLGLLKNARLETLGDAGVLLEVHFYSNEKCVQTDLKRAKASLAYWMKTFNERYVHIVEDEMRLALTNFKRSMNGHFARLSAHRKPQHSVRAAAHICAALAKHPSGLELMQQEGTLTQLLTVIREPLTKDMCVKMKAALLALGHIIGQVDEECGECLFAPDTIELICEFAERCPYLSVRGIAFFALNLAAQSKYGVRELTKLGWESNRHMDLQEKLVVQLRAQQNHETKCDDQAKLPEYESESLEEFRSSRSDSLYTRAGNESLAALRRRSAKTRRHNNPYLNHNRTSDSSNQDMSEPMKIDLDQLEFDIEMYSVLNNPTIKPSEILLRKAMKKDDSKRASTLANNFNSRLLQREFLTYVKGIAVFDKFWLLSDSETSKLMEYRNLLELAETSRRVLAFDAGGEKSNLEKSLIQNSVSNNWTVCTVPREMQLISENVFNCTGSTTTLSIEHHQTSLSASGNEHDSQKCFYCLSKKGELKSSVGELFTKYILSDEQKSDYEQRRDDILLSMTMLDVREHTYRTRLANHYRACTLFHHPCVNADALELLSELSFSLETRSFIQQLFWQCLPQLLGN